MEPSWPGPLLMGNDPVDWATANQSLAFGKRAAWQWLVGK